MGYIGYTQDVSKTLTVDYSFSSDMTDYVNVSNNSSSVNQAEREEKYDSKVIAKWVPNEHHSIAFGGEWQHDEFGLRSSMWPGSPAIASIFKDPCSTHPLYNPTGRMPRWSTDMYSLLGEYQLTINDQWTTFVGGRFDDHSMTDQNNVLAACGGDLYADGKRHLKTDVFQVGANAGGRGCEIVQYADR